MTLSLRQLFFAFIATSSLLLSGCGPDDKSDGQKPSPPRCRQQLAAHHRQRQREVHAGKPPQRIVSTSVTITGTLLAIDAPVVASGATSPNPLVADKQGFFTQWSR